MRFSVIMPCYKTRREYVEKALKSIRAQFFNDWELVFVDDNPAGSRWKEESQSIATEYSSDLRMHFVFHADNRGANVARNTAVRAASGEWLAFLDADDTWDPEYLTRVDACIATVADCSLVTTPIRICNGVGVKQMPPSGLSGMIFGREICGDLLSPSSGICARRDALIEAGLFDEALPARQDYDMWLRICKRHPVGSVAEVGVTVNRDGHDRISSSNQRHIDGTLAVIEKIKADGDIEDDLRQRAVDSHCKYLWKLCLRSGDSSGAKRFARFSSSAGARAFRLAVSPFAPLISSSYAFIRQFLYK